MQERAQAPLRTPQPPAAPPHQQPQAAPPQRHLQLVPRQSWLSANRRRLVLGAALAAATVMCFALVALHVLIAENQFTLDRLQQQAAGEQANYERLRLQVASLEAPARIVSLAEGRLGMVQPASVTYLPAVAGASSTSARGTAAAGNPGTRTSNSAPRSGPIGSSTVPAPAGDANWPGVKPYLSGNP